MADTKRGRLTVVEEGLHLRDLGRTTRQSIDPLHIQSKQLDGLEALVHDHGDSGPVSLIEIVQGDTKHGLQRRKVLRRHIICGRWWAIDHSQHLLWRRGSGRLGVCGLLEGSRSERIRVMGVRELRGTRCRRRRRRWRLRRSLGRSEVLLRECRREHGRLALVLRAALGRRHNRARRRPSKRLVTQLGDDLQSWAEETHRMPLILDLLRRHSAGVICVA